MQSRKTQLSRHWSRTCNFVGSASFSAFVFSGLPSDSLILLNFPTFLQSTSSLEEMGCGVGVNQTARQDKRDNKHDRMVNHEMCKLHTYMVLEANVSPQVPPTTKEYIQFVVERT